MLAALRNTVRSWYIKALLFLLILAFAVWGIGDIFRNTGSGEVVAEVGGTEISALEVMREADGRFRELQQQFGGRLERSPVIMQSLYGEALQQIIAGRLVDVHARDLGLHVSDAELARQIRREPAFDSGAGFDSSRFDLFLSSIGMSEAGYIEMLRSDMLRQRIGGAIGGAGGSQEILAGELARWRSQERRGEALVVLADRLEVGEPGPGDLEAYLVANQARFMAPEYRRVELIRLGVEDVIAEIPVAEEAIAEAYRLGRARYATPESRTAVQILAADRDAAAEAIRLLESGLAIAELEAAMPEANLSIDEIGPVRRGELPPALDEAIFGLGEAELSGAVETPFGWHVLRLSRIEPEVTTPLEEVRDAIADELRRDAALDRIHDVATVLDDEIAGGASLEEAAGAAGARFDAIEAIDERGRDQAGEPALEPALDPEILAAMFEGEEGEVSLLNETGAGEYYLYRIVAVTPERPRDLDEVEAQVRSAWLADRRVEAAQDRARAILESSPAPADFAALAAQDGAIEVLPLGPLRRDDADPVMGAEPVVRLFETEPGAIAAEPATVEGGIAIVATLEVIEGEADTDMVARELAIGQRDALFGQYDQALRQTYTIEVDQAAMTRLLDQPGL